LNGISEKYASCQSTPKKVNQRLGSANVFKANNKPNIVRSADINANRKNKFKIATKKAQIYNKILS